MQSIELTLMVKTVEREGIEYDDGIWYESMTMVNIEAYSLPYVSVREKNVILSEKGEKTRLEFECENHGNRGDHHNLKMENDEGMDGYKVIIEPNDEEIGRFPSR